MKKTFWILAAAVVAIGIIALVSSNQSSAKTDQRFRKMNTAPIKVNAITIFL
jgi:hypothetical protein